MSKIKKISNFNFIALTTIIAIIVLTLNLALTSSSASLIVSVFAQTPSIHLDYKFLEVSNSGVIKGKIIQENSNTNDNIGFTQQQQQVKIKAIAVGQTLVHCLNTEENKDIVKSSNPFLATAQGAFTISKPSTVFNLQLQPNIGNVNCNQDSIVRGPATVFSNIEVSISP